MSETISDFIAELAQELELDHAKLSPTAALLGNRSDLDSIQQVELVAWLEELTDEAMSDELLDSLVTVEQIYSWRTSR